MTSKDEAEGAFVEATLDQLYADPETNLRPIESAAVEKMASFIISIGKNGITTNIRVRPKGAKGYPVTFGFQRVGAAQFITRASQLVDEMLEITAEEEKKGEDLPEKREALEKKWTEPFINEFLAWKDTAATKEALTEQRGEKESEKEPFSLTEVAKLLKSWLPKIATVPARIFEDKSEIDRTFLQLAENIDRQDLSPVAEARGVAKLVDHFVEKKNMEKIPAMELVGRRLGGRSLSWVQQSLGLLKTAPEVQQALESGEVSRSQGLIIAREKGKGTQVELLERAKKGVSVAALNKIRKPAKTAKAGGKKKGANKQASLLPAGPKLEFKVGKHAIVFAEDNADTNEFTVVVDGEEGLRFQITKKGAIKVSGASAEVLSLKTDLGHLEVHHDSTTEERFSVDVDGVEKGALVLDGKGGVDYEVTKVGDQQPARVVKGKKQNKARKAKAKKKVKAAAAS